SFRTFISRHATPFFWNAFSIFVGKSPSVAMQKIRKKPPLRGSRWPEEGKLSSQLRCSQHAAWTGARSVMQAGAVKSPVGAGEERRIAKICKHFKWLTARAIDLVGRNVGRFVGRRSEQF